MATLPKSADLSLSPAATLPPEVALRLLSESDQIARRMTRYIAAGVALGDPQFRSHHYLRTVTAACRDAFRTLIRLLNDGRGLRPGDLDRLGSMGAQQAELGVPLEVVFGAYRVAARVVFQEVVGQPALLDQVPPATVVAVTARVLEYLDEISAAVGSAYLATRERLMRQRDRERDRTLQRLLAGDAGDELRRIAAAVGLELTPPYRVVAAATHDSESEHRLDTVWRDAGALATSDTPGVWTLLVAPSVDVAALCERVPGAIFGVGPVAASLRDVAAAARDARSALDVGVRLDPERSVHNHDDLGPFATLSTDPQMLRRYVERTLGAVLVQRQPRRDELIATLDAVTSRRNVAEAAVALGVHRHTIVYRLSRLKELGIDLDDRDRSHAVWLALRCANLLDER
ncbi:MAG: helix-turn-helix domain-containing protein [Candidatus Dormibacteraeota bacterium]|nr:helix-turn-helix domain-containing protein [Candidatus Dormibacteraeota bacterium]MBV8445270.1 helix-turn-helix domain-containing protein [Candidatus Dormibacteraeota bacterium]